MDSGYYCMHPDNVPLAFGIEISPHHHSSHLDKSSHVTFIYIPIFAI